MNKRIRELAEQAGFETGYNGYNAWYNEKFAELLVRECADIGERYADGNYEVPRQILARFGMGEDEE